MSNPNGVSDKIAILNLLDAFVACIKTKDQAQMNSMVMPGGAVTQLRNGQVETKTLAELIESLPLDIDMAETLSNVQVHVAPSSEHGGSGARGDSAYFAGAWAPSAIYVGEQLVATGSTVIGLCKREQSEGGWAILSVTDIMTDVIPLPPDAAKA